MITLAQAKAKIKALVRAKVNQSEANDYEKSSLVKMLDIVYDMMVPKEEGKELAHKPEIKTAAPSAQPSAVPQLYIDTTNKKAYISVGTSAVTDWKEITNAVVEG